MDSLQAITSTSTTEAFGNAVSQWGSSANPYRFAGAWGYRNDGDAGLLHVGALLRPAGSVVPLTGCRATPGGSPLSHGAGTEFSP